MHRSSMAPLELGPAVLGPRSSCAGVRMAGRVASGVTGGAGGAGGVAPFEMGPAAGQTGAALAGRWPTRERERESPAAVRAARRRRRGAKPPLRRSGSIGSSPFSTIGTHASRSSGNRTQSVLLRSASTRSCSGANATIPPKTAARIVTWKASTVLQASRASLPGSCCSRTVARSRGPAAAGHRRTEGTDGTGCMAVMP